MPALTSLLAAMLACSAPGLATPGPTATPTSTATPTATASPTPTPTLAPSEELGSADRARFEGDWDSAIAHYTDVLNGGGTSELAASAELGLGLTLLQSEDYAEAEARLSGYLDRYPQDPNRGQAFFLRAQARLAQGRPAEAVDDYRQYLELRPGKIDSRVHEAIGDALRAAGQPAAAVQDYQDALAQPHLAGDVGLQMKIGLSLYEAGDLSGALDKFDEIYRFASDDATRASANLLAGQALEDMGDASSAYARYQDSVDHFPGAYDTYAGLVRLVNAGVPVDDFQRGLVDFNAAAYEPALPALERAVLSEPTGTAWYYLGLTRRSLGDADGALAAFRESLQAYPEDPHFEDAWFEAAYTEWAYLDRYTDAVQTYLDFATGYPQSGQAAQAMFNAGRTAERNQDLRRAAEIWLGLPETFPGSPLGYEAAFQAAIVLFRAADFGGAQGALNQAAELAASSGDQAAVDLWLGKTDLARGDSEGAQAAWQAAAGLDPTGYYSERASDLLAGRQPFEPTGVFNFSTDPAAERAEAEAWMRTTFSLPDEVALGGLGQSLASDPRWTRGRELWQLGQTGPAKDELESLRHAVENDPVATYQLMHALLDLGLYQPAIYAARQVLNLAGLDDAGTMQAPVYFNHIRFGPYFGDLILPEALHDELDGLFLLSIVRQESLFEGFITSYAAARGLMQIIPSTGQSIADQMAWPPGYTDDDLFRPIVSVKFGAFYLSQQRDRFDGDLFAALAAYNAGPGNASLWKDLAPDDPDLYLEVIRIDQTHQYLTTIYEVFDIYRNLYAQAPSN